MGRGLLGAAIVATLLATAVAVGAGTDVRLHRLHVPPPPSVDASESAPPPAPSKPAPPAPPGTVAPPAAPSPPGSVPPPPAGPPPPPPPPAGVGCTASGGGTPADATGTLSDFQIDLAPTAVAAAATLRFRGVNTPGSSTHNLSLRDSGNTRLCGTPNLTAGTAETFIVTNLPPGGYELYCTIHPGSMHEALTVS